MFSVLLVGESAAGSGTEALIAACLRRFFTVVSCFKDELGVEGEGEPQCLLCHARNFPERIAMPCIAVFLDNVKMLGSGAGCPPFDRLIAVMNSSNKEAVEFARQARLRTVLTGVGQKDTVTLSSNTESSVVVSLVREIETLSGKRIEPFDMPVNCSEIGVSDLLLVCALLMICGRPDALNEDLFMSQGE